MLRFVATSLENMTIENLRLALFNYIVSKQLNKELLIRIEDLEKDKNTEGKDKEIIELLSLFSIEYKAVLYQSDNLKYHQKLAMQLMSEKKAFACFCSDQKLEEIKEQCTKEGKYYSYDDFCKNLSDETVLNCNAPFTVRIKRPNKSIEFSDLIKGKISYEPNEIDSFIILKHDKTPTYNYACSVDDMLNDISMIIREEKYLLNTSKQIHVRNQFNYNKNIDYIHIPSLCNVENNKKSNEENDVNSVKWLIDEGFLPSAIANYLVLLGSETPSEIFTIEEAIEWFDIKKLSKDLLIFDIDKLRLINKQHIFDLDEMRLSKILGFADIDIGKLGKLYLKEVSTINELKAKIDLIFSSKDSLEGFKEEFSNLKQCLSTAPFMDDFNELEKYIKENTKLEDKSLSIALRYLLTGINTGPELSDIYPFIKNYIGEIVK